MLISLTTILFALPQVSLSQGEQGLTVVPLHPTRVVDGWFVESLNRGEFSEQALWQVLPGHWAQQRSGEDVHAGWLRASQMVASRTGRSQQSVQAALAELMPSAVKLHMELWTPDGSQRMFGGEVVGQGGVSTGIQEVARKSMLKDFDVELAQGAVIADPIRGIAWNGLSLAARCYPAGKNDWLTELAVVFSQEGKEEIIETNYHSMHGVERLNRNLAELSTWALLAPGTEQHWTLPDALGGWVLKVRALGDLPPQSLEVDDLMVRYSPLLARESFWPELVESLRWEGDTWADSTGWLVFGDEKRRDLATRVSDEVKNRLQLKSFQARIWSEGEQEGDVSVQWTGNLGAGAPSYLAAGATSQSLIDWDVEVACCARIADPVFKEFFSGLSGSLALLEDGRIRVDLDSTRVDHQASRLLRIAGAVAASEGHEGPMPAMPTEDVRMEMPSLARIGFHGAFEPNEQGVVLLRRTVFGSDGLPGNLVLEISLTD
ncbi:MAG: hypothetical protein MK213_09165 [Planctomycetes bacterium]|nr:hypothetical protein [Planctomycetota bacterium]